MQPKRAIILVLGVMALAACHPGADDVTPAEPRAGAKAEGEHAPPQAKRITIDADGMSHAQIQELVEHVEGIGDIASAKVMVKQDDKGATAILIEVAGADLPGDDYLRQEIQTFPGLSDAAVDVASVRPDAVASGGMVDAADKSPAEIKAEVEAQLAAQGIEGEVVVDVIDDGNGERRVEVQVHSDKDVPAR